MMMDDVEKVLFTKERLAAKAAELGAQISQDYADKEIFAVGILKGAFVFASDLVRNISRPVQMDFMSASSYGAGTKSSGTVKIMKDLDFDIAGKNDIRQCRRDTMQVASAKADLAIAGASQGEPLRVASIRN